MAWVLSQNRCKFRKDSTAQRVTDMYLSPQGGLKGFKVLRSQSFKKLRTKKYLKKV